MFTEVEQALEEEIRNKNHRIYRSFTLPIPDCQNQLVSQALEDNPTHLLFIEEDVVIPKDGLTKLLAANTDVAFIDYAVAGWSCRAKDRKTGEILWCGLGCTLIKTGVFDKLEKPYFRVDKILLLNDWPEQKWIDAGPKMRYGGQDIWFCRQVKEKGFQIVQVEGECRHLKLDKLGSAGINNGLHQISEKEKITKENLIS